MFLFFLRKKRLSCSYVLSILGKRKECFCSYFFQIAARAVLNFGESEAQCSYRVVLIRKKKVLLKTFVYLHAPSND